MVSNEVYRVYSAMRRGEMSIDEVYNLAKDAAVSGNVALVDYLSNIIYSRGDEKIKINYSKLLYKMGFGSYVPFPYLMKLKNELGKDVFDI